MAKTTKMVEVAVSSLKPYDRNAKKHGEKQLEKLKASIEEFGFLTPCLIDKENNIIAGHGRVMAAKELGLKTVPCVYIEGLTEAQRKAYVLADNRLGELGEWDMELVNAELEALNEEGFDISLTGFELDLDSMGGGASSEDAIDPTAALPESRMFVTAISAFGTDSERFVEVKLEQETVDRLLQRFGEMQPGELTDKIREALNAI